MLRLIGHTKYQKRGIKFKDHRQAMELFIMQYLFLKIWEQNMARPAILLKGT